MKIIKQYKVIFVAISLIIGIAIILGVLYYNNQFYAQRVLNAIEQEDITQLKKLMEEVFTNAPDIVKTSEKFGGEYHSGSKIIVSQRFYQFVMENHLGSVLEFKPIELL